MGRLIGQAAPHVGRRRKRDRAVHRLLQIDKAGDESGGEADHRVDGPVVIGP